jgi:hypothetical protein
MSMKTTELIPGRISFTHGQGVVTTDEGNRISTAMLNLMNESSDTDLYHHIVHFLDVEKVPLNFSALKPSATGEVLSHPKMGWFVIVSTNKVFAFMTDVILQVTKVRNRHFQTLEEAIEFLKEVDSTIDWSQMNQDISGLS